MGGRLRAAAAMALAAGAAQAQTPSDSRIPQVAPAEIPEGRMNEADRARATTLAYADCLVARDRSNVEHVLAMPPAAWDQAMHRLADDACLGEGQLKMSILIMRGGLFAALYRADYARAPGPLAPAPLPPAAPAPGEAQAAETHRALLAFADCAARDDPADSRAAVLSAPGSAQEAAAYARLAPHLGVCLPQGQELHFSKAILSGALAEALVEEARAAAAAPPSPMPPAPAR